MVAEQSCVAESVINKLAIPQDRTYNPETSVRFPVSVTTFYFTLNKTYTDSRSSRKKLPLLFFSIIQKWRKKSKIFIENYEGTEKFQ